jgi:DNA-binding MarR family transcriptional regulator
MGEFTDFTKAVDHIRSKRQAKFSNYILTEIGKKKLSEEYSGAGIEWDILNDLEDNGPSTKREISSRIHADEKATKGALDRLIAKQRVTMVAR